MNSQELTRLIIQYLSKHPDAGDSIEGITNWWVRQEMGEMFTARVSQTVDGLVLKGILLKRQAGGSVDLYYLNKMRLEEVNEILSSASKDVGK